MNRASSAVLNHHQRSGCAVSCRHSCWLHSPCELPIRVLDSGASLKLECWSLELTGEMGWPTGFEPATARSTIWGSNQAELRPPQQAWNVRFQPHNVKPRLS